MKDQQKREAELRRQLELQPPLPDSDDEHTVASTGATSSSAAAAAVAAAGAVRSEMLDKAGNFFNNFKDPVAMFSSEPSPIAAPVPANRVNPAAAYPVTHPLNSKQTSVLDPPPPSSAPGSQDFQRKSLRLPDVKASASAAEAKLGPASDKVVRPLSFVPSTKQPLEARGTKPDFLTPPPPQAPEPSSALPPPPPPDSSLMSSVGYVIPHLLRLACV